MLSILTAIAWISNYSLIPFMANNQKQKLVPFRCCFGVRGRSDDQCCFLELSVAVEFRAVFSIYGTRFFLPLPLTTHTDRGLAKA